MGCLSTNEKGRKMEERTSNPTPPLSSRLFVLEKDIGEIKKQLTLYVPLRENDVELKGMRDVVDRIEKEIAEARKQLSDLGTKIIDQDAEAQHLIAAQRESQAALQIKVLWGTISLIVGLLTSVFVGYIIHLFH